jgi:hypothetical protein
MTVSGVQAVGADWAVLAERFSLGSSRRLTLQGFTRCRALRILGGFIVLA